MFHVEHKTRLSNLGHYSLCLNAKISFSLSSPEPRARVGIAPWSDHVVFQ